MNNMTINDLLAPNETIKISGTVIMYGDSITNISLTDQCIYLQGKDDYCWETIRYESISSLLMRFYGGKIEFTIYCSSIQTEFGIGQNYKWAEEIYRCIKNCWDEAKSGNSGGITPLSNSTNNPFDF